MFDHVKHEKTTRIDIDIEWILNGREGTSLDLDDPFTSKGNIIMTKSARSFPPTIRLFTDDCLTPM